MTRIIKTLAFGLMMVGVTPALANEICNTELKPYFDKKKAYEVQLQAINKQAKKAGSREKFCATMGGYIGNMRSLVAYIEKNKDFCGVPDDQVAAAKKGLGQNISLRKKICSGPPPQARPRPGQAPGLPPPPVNLRLQ